MGIVHRRAPVNPHLRQDTLNELQVRFPLLSDKITRRDKLKLRHQR